MTYDSATNRATLNPNANLTGRGHLHGHVDAPRAKDLAGNALDQNPSTAGNQAKSWKFKVKP